MSKYLVLCIAGQSNAVGFDESPVAPDYLRHFRTEKIWQLGFLPEHNLEIVPLGACAENYQDMRPFGNPLSPGIGTKGMHLPLADLLAKDPVLADYDILVIPCAYGGCGFTVGEEGSYDAAGMRPSEGQIHWGIHSPFYLAMKDRITFALQQDPENRFLGVVWVQGEHDHDAPSQQIEAFDEMTEDFFRDMAERNPGRIYRRNITRQEVYRDDAMRRQQEDYRNDVTRWQQEGGRNGQDLESMRGVTGIPKAEPYPGQDAKGNDAVSGWNRNIWYNVETVAYWYETYPGCRRIWQHYREWNPATYVEIPRDTDSNEINGTGITASIRAAHYGNDAFWRVVAPRVYTCMKGNGRIDSQQY